MSGLEMGTPLSMVGAIILGLIIGVTAGRIFRPTTAAPPVLPFMANVHYLVWTGAAIVLVVIAVEASGASMPEYVIGLVNAFIGGIAGAYGTLLQLYGKLYGETNAKVDPDNSD